MIIPSLLNLCTQYHNYYADQLDLPAHIHLHEAHDEMMYSLNTCGLCPLARLYQHGLPGSRLIGVHMIHLIESEIKLLRQQDCNNAHCPSPDLKLASGFALVSDLLHMESMFVLVQMVLIVTRQQRFLFTKRCAWLL